MLNDKWIISRQIDTLKWVGHGQDTTNGVVKHVIDAAKKCDVLIKYRISTVFNVYE